MRTYLHNGKKVIWESRRKRISLILITFLFILIGLLFYRMGESSGPWLLATFFGCCGEAFLLFQFLDPNNLFVTPGSELGREILERHKDLGAISYVEDGFRIKNLAGYRYHKWADIQTIFGYKLDLLNTDEICIDIFFDDGSGITIDESTSGWPELDQQLIEHNLFVPLNWQADIAFPAFPS